MVSVNGYEAGLVWIADQMTNRGAFTLCLLWFFEVEMQEKIISSFNPHPDKPKCNLIWTRGMFPDPHFHLGSS